MLTCGLLWVISYFVIMTLKEIWAKNITRTSLCMSSILRVCSVYVCMCNSACVCLLDYICSCMRACAVVCVCKCTCVYSCVRERIGATAYVRMRKRAAVCMCVG